MVVYMRQESYHSSTSDMELFPHTLHVWPLTGSRDSLLPRRETGSRDSLLPRRESGSRDLWVWGLLYSSSRCCCVEIAAARYIVRTRVRGWLVANRSLSANKHRAWLNQLPRLIIYTSIELLSLSVLSFTCCKKNCMQAPLLRALLDSVPLSSSSSRYQRSRDDTDHVNVVIFWFPLSLL